MPIPSQPRNKAAGCRKTASTNKPHTPANSPTRNSAAPWPRSKPRPTRGATRAATSRAAEYAAATQAIDNPNFACIGSCQTGKP